MIKKLLRIPTGAGCILTIIRLRETATDILFVATGIFIFDRHWFSCNSHSYSASVIGACRLLCHATRLRLPGLSRSPIRFEISGLECFHDDYLYFEICYSGRKLTFLSAGRNSAEISTSNLNFSAASGDCWSRSLEPSSYFVRRGERARKFHSIAKITPQEARNYTCERVMTKLYHSC